MKYTITLDRECAFASFEAAIAHFDPFLCADELLDIRDVNAMLEFWWLSL